MMPIIEMEAERRFIADVVVRRRRDMGRAFAERVVPTVDAALAGSVAGLGRELGGLEGVIARAVGIDGPAGRRWRPLLGAAAAVAAGGRIADALPVGIAVELTHTASLVLDDLPCMDDSMLRRGASATHREVGTAGAILVSIGLLGRAAEAIAAAPAGAAELGAAWGHAIGLRGMSGGQALDLAATSTMRGAARRLHREKTVALCVLALEGAGRAAGGGPEACLALRRFATDLGWAYQLADDAADQAQDGAIGRPPGGRAPLRQSARLMRRAERRLHGAAGLNREGVEILVELGRSVVPVLDPAPDPTPDRTTPLRRSRPAC